MKKIVRVIIAGLMISIVSADLSAIDSIAFYRRPHGVIIKGVVYTCTGVTVLTASGFSFLALACGNFIHKATVIPFCGLAVGGWLRQVALIHRWNK